MTKEEAIEIVCNAFDIWYGEYTYIDDWSKEFEARDMAIEALEQEPCEDAVSRQTVKEQMIYYGFLAPDMTVTEFVEDCLPSVKPQKIGHWIIEKWNNKEHYSCSSCQHVVDYEPCYHYCPYCGAKMVEPQESEVQNEH